MVRPLLLLPIGAAFLWGCLLSNPPDYEEPIDYRPVVEQFEPKQLVSINLDETPGYTTFTADLRDENLDQNLQFRWYLNFTPKVEEGDQCGCIYSALAPRRAEEGTHRAQILFPVSLLVEGKCHRLTVVVTDGQWTDAEGNCGCTGVEEGANRTFVDWLIAALSANVEDASFRDCQTQMSNNPLADEYDESSE